MELVLGYVKELYCFSRSKVLLNVLLMVALGMLQGIGIVILIPLLSVTGVIADMQADSTLTRWINYMFQYIGLPINLPIILVLYISINLGQSWLERYQSLLTIEIQQSFMRLLAFRLFRAVMYAKWQLIINRTKADIIHVLTSLLPHVTGVTTIFFNMMTSGLITILQIILAFIVAPVLTALVLVCAGSLLIFLRSFAEISRKQGQEMLNLNRDLFSNITENLQGIKEIKSYGSEKTQFDNYCNNILTINQNYLSFSRFQSWTDMSYKVGAVVFISLFLFCATTMFKIQSQDLILIAVISYRLWPRFSSLEKNFQSLNLSVPAIRYIKELEFECFAAQENLPDDGKGSQINLKQGIEFHQVSFSYKSAPEKHAVKDVSFVLPAGTTTAFVGVSGSGKSTLVDLLIGLLIPNNGDILIDSEPLLENLRSWRNSIGYVPQDAFLFNASIKENLLWVCPDVTEENIWDALRFASVDSFIASLPDGLDTVVGDRGVRLSGGERQRIVLARALLRKPAVLILDEATSSLDSENEKRIQQAIENLQGKMTIVVIAHRISTIRNADRILVLDHGRIVEQGNYQSLMKKGGSRFQTLASSYVEC